MWRCEQSGNSVLRGPGIKSGHSDRSRREWGFDSVIYALCPHYGVIAVISSLLASLMVFWAPVGPAQASLGFDNARMADIALSYVGQPGVNACLAAGKGTAYAGQCKQFVNCIVVLAGGPMPGGSNDYAGSFIAAGGTEISEAAATKGDIIQWGSGSTVSQHTAIVVSNLGGGRFDVVDSNWGTPGLMVNHHTIANIHADIFNGAGAQPTRFIRMGTVGPPAGSPIGCVDAVQGFVGGGARLQGWVMDPDAKTQPTSIHVYVDGQAGSGARGVNLGIAAFSRPDVAAAYPGSSAEHGFNTGIMGLAPGSHTLFVYGINVAGTPGDNVLLGEVGVTVPSSPTGTPLGNGDAITGSIGGASTAGWAFDPDVPTAPVEIHTYVDGPAGSGARFVGLGLANVDRPDVAKAYPQAGPTHGFNTWVTGLAPGQHTLFLYAINKSGSGDNPLIGILTTGVASGSPVGYFDGIADGHGAIAIRGWAIDPDSPGEGVAIHAYLDGEAGSGARGVDLGPASASRADVGKVYPGAGPNHGFDMTIPDLSTGHHTVFVYAINAKAPGQNVLLGSKTVVVTAPLTAKQPVQPTPGTAGMGRVTGLAVKRIGRHKMRVSWRATTGATGYELRVLRPYKHAWQVVPGTGTVVHVRPGRMHKVAVRGVNGAAHGPVAKLRFRVRA